MGSNQSIEQRVEADHSFEHKLLPGETDVVQQAFTPGQHGYIPPYPWYLNLTMVRRASVSGGHVVLTVRAPTVIPVDMKLEGRTPGDTASVRLTWEMWRELVKLIESSDRQFSAANELDAML